MDGQMNLTYFKLLADTKDRREKIIGYCVVELLPGVCNEKINVKAAWKKV